MSATAIRPIAANEEWSTSEAQEPFSTNFEVHKTEVRWNLFRRIAFRFTFIYLSLYCLAYPVGMFSDFLFYRYINLWGPAVRWAGRSLFGVNITVMPNGSGDTTFDYVLAFCFLMVALAGTALWTALDRRRGNYEKVYQWLKLSVCIALGCVLLGYGAMKVMCTQMPSPSLSSLLEPYGDSSPMGLLWTFIGASKPYSVFCGSVEMLAGILLFIPGCVTLGALLAAAAMTNVFILNMCYDVPVKLFSFHLLLIAVFLAAPDLRRLVDFLLLRRRTELSPDIPLFRRKWLNRMVAAMQIGLGLFLAAFMLYSFRPSLAYAGETLGAPLYGIWAVEEYSVDGKVQPPLTTEESRWQRIVFDSRYSTRIEFMNGTSERLLLALDKGKSGLAFSKVKDKQWKAQFAYENPQPGILLLSGNMNGHRVNARLRHDDRKFLLVSRGFHWIQEYPYIR